MEEDPDLGGLRKPLCTCLRAKLLLACSIFCLPYFAQIYAQLLNSKEKKQTCPISYCNTTVRGLGARQKMAYIDSKLLWPRTQLSHFPEKCPSYQTTHLLSEWGCQGVTCRECCLLWAVCKSLSFPTFPSCSPAQSRESLSPGKAMSLQEKW